MMTVAIGLAAHYVASYHSLVYQISVGGPHCLATGPLFGRTRSACAFTGINGDGRRFCEFCLAPEPVPLLTYNPTGGVLTDGNRSHSPSSQYPHGAAAGHFHLGQVQR